jgi:hypothetical protein
MKQITHSIGGQDRILDVGKMWFTKFFGESTSSDPLFMSELLGKPDKQFEFICGLVYAGINCYNKVVNNGEFVSLETVHDWVGVMDQSEAASLIGKFAEVNKVQEQGEK